MKKKILGITLIVTLAVVAAFNINLNKSNAKGDLAMANVEALAQAEVVPVADEVTCYSTFNNCWFWDCSTIWQCDVVECVKVSCDSQSDAGKCTPKKS